MHCLGRCTPNCFVSVQAAELVSVTARSVARCLHKHLESWCWKGMEGAQKVALEPEGTALSRRNLLASAKFIAHMKHGLVRNTCQ